MGALVDGQAATADEAAREADRQSGISDVFSRVARTQKEAAAALADLGEDAEADAMLSSATVYYRNAATAAQRATDARKRQMQLLAEPSQ